MELLADFKNKYRKLLGDEADAFFSSFDAPVHHGFRINPLKAFPPENVDLNHPVPYCKWGYYGKVNGKSVEHQSGSVYSQEPSAMYVGEVAAPKPGMRVLDLCAAPGGKTTHLASFMDNQGLLVTNEIMRNRAKVLVENVERFGVQNALILNEDPDTLAKHFRGYFDQILVDAPCSGEGMFHKNPDAMNYWSLDYPKECAKRQKQILKATMKMLRPGGELVYSTCTFAPEEDEQIIAWLMQNYDVTIVPIKKYEGMVDAKPQWADNNPQIKNAVRLFPHLFKGEGHFIAKLKLAGDGKAKRIKKPQATNLNHDEVALWDEYLKKNVLDFNPKSLLTFGDKLYSYVKGIPNLKGLKVMRPGLELGTFKKNRFEPSYALSLALHADQMKNNLTVSDEQWKKYMHGDTISVDKSFSKGWYQLINNRQPFAFGKVVNGTVKNFFPKGLRFKV